MTYEIYKNLKVPYDKHFYNLKFSHYEMLAEHIGIAKVNRYVRELLVACRHDQYLAEKARILLHRLNTELMFEKNNNNPEECDCDFQTLGEVLESCPVCLKEFYKGKVCFYKNSDSSCSQDGEGCTYLNRKECGK